MCCLRVWVLHRKLALPWSWKESSKTIRRHDSESYKMWIKSSDRLTGDQNGTLLNQKLLNQSISSCRRIQKQTHHHSAPWNIRWWTLSRKRLPPRWNLGYYLFALVYDDVCPAASLLNYSCIRTFQMNILRSWKLNLLPPVALLGNVSLIGHESGRHWPDSSPPFCPEQPLLKSTTAQLRQSE